MQRPSALALLICDQVIIDRDSGKRTYVGEIDEWTCEEPPFHSPPFVVSAALTDGQGTIALNLVITYISDEEEEVVAVPVQVPLPNPLVTARIHVRFQPLTFPEYGQYLFELYCGDDPICHRRLNIVPREE